MNEAAAGNKTSNTSGLVFAWYSKVFLERAATELIHKQGAQMRSHGGNDGKDLTFTRFEKIVPNTTPLPEGNNPTVRTLTTAPVTVTLAEYGDAYQVSKLLSTTDIDQRDKEKIEVVGEGMGRTLDQVVREALYAGATPVTATSGNLTAVQIRRAAAKLKKNGAPRYAGKFPFMGKLSVEAEYDLMGDSTWENAKVHSDVKDLYAGEIGALFGVRLMVGNDSKVVSSGGTTPVDHYSNFFHGKDAFGVYDNSADKPKLYIVRGADSNNPAERFNSISWAGQYAAKVLNSDFVVDVRTLATAV